MTFGKTPLHNKKGISQLFMKPCYSEKIIYSQLDNVAQCINPKILYYTLYASMFQTDYFS